MDKPTPIGGWRDAKEAHDLCKELARLCAEHTNAIVLGALSGLISMLPPELQAPLAAGIVARLGQGDDALPLPGETSTAIEKIVKGLT